MNKVESALSRTTDTKALVIGTETLPQVADMFRKLFPDKRALVVADANTWRVAGDDVHKILALSLIHILLIDEPMRSSRPFVERVSTAPTMSRRFCTP